MSNTRWLNKLDDRQKLIITQYERGDSGGGRTLSVMKAALPESFGLSVGSVFTDPFNANITTNPTAERIASYLNISRKLGSRVTSIFYSGPEPTEISMELEFNAFYSAEDEVVVPIVQLMLMSVGRENNLADLRRLFESSPVGLLRNNVASFIESIENSAGGDIAGEIKAIKGPNPCSVKFGNVINIDKAYISTAAPSFSNVLDNQFMPMQATCAVTIKIERNPLYTDIIDMFGGRNPGGQDAQ